MTRDRAMDHAKNISESNNRLLESLKVPWYSRPKQRRSLQSMSKKLCLQN